MDTRGIVVEGTCPRCGTKTVPTAERMVTCAACTLRFDTHATPLTSRRRRSPLASVRRPRFGDFVVEKPPGAVVVRFPSSPVMAGVIGVVAVGFVAVAVAMLLDRPAWWGVTVVLFAGAALLGYAAVNVGVPLQIRIDADAVACRGQRIARADVADVTATYYGTKWSYYAISVVRRDGKDRILMFHKEPSVAGMVVREILDAMAAIPPRSR